jgi:hypothetical protein
MYGPDEDGKQTLQSWNVSEKMKTESTRLVLWMLVLRRLAMTLGT